MAQEGEGGGVQEELLLTLGSPAWSAWPERGRRQGIWRRRSRIPAGKRRRFLRPRADSVEGEEEGGEAEVHGKSAELGASPSGGGRRRQWRRLWSLRCFYGRERKGASQRESEREEGVVSLLRVSRGTPWPSEAASRRWRRLGPAQDTQVREVEDKKFFKKPPGLGRFSRKIQDSTLLYYLVIKTCSGI
jgi:hypothetical protein